MKRFFIIMAKSASGKDTIYHRLITNESLGLIPIILYYTRPIREGEVDGREFRFRSNEQMEKILKGDNVIHTEKYGIVGTNGCTIALLDDDQMERDGNYLVVMNPYFYKSLCRYFKCNGDVEIFPIYIDVPGYLRVERSMLREERETTPNYGEICRRFVSDEKMFMDEVISNLPKENIFENIDLNECCNAITQFIIRKSCITAKELCDLFIQVNNGGSAADAAKEKLLYEFRKYGPRNPNNFSHVWEYAVHGELDRLGSFDKSYSRLRAYCQGICEDILDVTYPLKTKVNEDYITKGVLEYLLQKANRAPQSFKDYEDAKKQLFAEFRKYGSRNEEALTTALSYCEKGLLNDLDEFYENKFQNIVDALYLDMVLPLNNPGPDAYCQGLEVVTRYEHCNSIGIIPIGSKVTILHMDDILGMNIQDTKTGLNVKGIYGTL